MFNNLRAYPFCILLSVCIMSSFSQERKTGLTAGDACTCTPCGKENCEVLLLQQSLLFKRSDMVPTSEFKTIMTNRFVYHKNEKKYNFFFLNHSSIKRSS